MSVVEGNYQNISRSSFKIAIVAARFNQLVVDSLLGGALELLVRFGIDKERVDIIRVPGAYELPLVCKKLAQTHRYKGLIALGAVIRGATTHYDVVAGAAGDGLARIASETGIPIALGVLTTETLEQALERAGSKHGNKGADAALTLLELIDLLEKIDG